MNCAGKFEFEVVAEKLFDPDEVYTVVELRSLNETPMSLAKSYRGEAFRTALAREVGVDIEELRNWQEQFVLEFDPPSEVP